MKKNVVKRILSTALVCVLTATMMIGCGKKGDSASNDAGASTDNGTVADDGTTNDVDNADPHTAENYPLNLTSVEAITHMGNGINLGNTMESYGHTTLGTKADTSAYETAWGQPVTTQEMIQGMKDSGFDTIRIPIAWTNMMDYESGDFTIDTALLDRVAEIVNWAIEAEMFVIINDHWDGSWWGMFGSATQATRDTAMEMYKSMWTQIGTYFKDYSGYLIFESANEELGDRLNDRDVCSDSGALSEDECYTTTNAINQAFVDTIRAIGGNNAERFLLIAGYNTNIADTRDSRFVMPTDTATNKLMVSVHYYDPWNYCGTEDQADWGIRSEYTTLRRTLQSMAQFTDAGYGVVVGEYGALPTSEGEMKTNCLAYTSALLDVCTSSNLCPILWDRGNFYSKINYEMRNTELAELFASNSYEAEKAADRATLIADADARVQAAIDVAPTEREIVIDMDAINAEGSHAWIMWSGYRSSYSVGDKYDPTNINGGVVATDAVITGAGTYTVALDFSKVEGGCDNGFSFSAIGLSNGEILYPGYLMDIKEVLINGEPYELIAEPYTTADDKICTRVNLYNGWVSKAPDEARSVDGTPADASAVIIDNTAFSEIKSIEITFEYIAP